ncbi:tryptophan 2,3-dioxygenase family protein [Nonomuraea candida]|uniref:tryptophan 2,3-dioxygenase family protein n=1 Tax=Nonomuraea candida TaxID=359159 RepID=UPI0006942A73|nr:tryptophan 2,3-dioxygenase family protein [Nonomuraea candida]
MTIEILRPPLPLHSEAMADHLASTALAELDGEELAGLSRRYDEAVARADTEMALLTRPFSSRLDIPEYYRYTGLHVFGWFLDREPDPYGGAVLAMHTILTDLAERERQEAARHPVPPEHIVERLHRLRPVLARLAELPVAPHGAPRGADLFRQAAADDRRLLALRRFCGFRRSDKHDEHIFIRAVQACELTFFMIRLAARKAIALAGADRAGQLFWLSQVDAGATLLNAIFHALKTLTPELFLGFRDATGDASAVQSLNYHLMELVLYGYDDRKAETYTRFGHLGVINDPRLREFRSLEDTAQEAADPLLAEAYGALERRLLVWRGRHYGFGRTYLPNMKGSGGTEGAGYLKRFVEKTGLGSGPRLDDPDGLLSGFAYR